MYRIEAFSYQQVEPAQKLKERFNSQNLSLILILLVAIYLIVVLLFFKFHTLNYEFKTNQKIVFKKCPHNIVPGITRMSRGVDITSLDLFPSDLHRTNGFRNSLFDFSCDHNHSWVHPTVEKYQYTLPDQIGAINTVSAGALSIKTSFHQDLNGYKRALELRVGLKAKVNVKGSFSGSVGYLDSMEQILQSNKSVAETSAYVSAIQMDFLSSDKMQLNQNFLSFINTKLPPKYETNPQIYLKFIETFGTHYFESAMFGGYLYQKTILDNDYIYRSDMKNISSNFRAKFVTFISTSVDASIQTNSTDSEFNSNSETHFYYYGGKTDLANQKNNNHISKWSESVFKDPWLFAGRLVPIESLIKDENIQKQVKKAIAIYLAKANLKDLQNVLYLGKIHLPETESQNLLNIEKYLSDSKLDTNELNKIGIDIDLLFDRVQEIRDRAYLHDYHSKMAQLWASTIDCKYSITRWCKSSPMRTELEIQHLQYENVKENKIAKLLNQSSPPDSRKVVELIQEATKLMHYHESTKVDLCGKEKDEECQKCLEEKADCWFSDQKVLACKNPVEWRNIGYQPKMVAKCREILYGE